MVETLVPRTRLRARDIMTSPVITVGVDTPVKDVVTTMLTHRISGVPVLSEQGELVGIVTEADLLYKETDPRPRDPGYLAAHLPLPPFVEAVERARKAEGITAGDLMTSPVVTVEEDTPVHEIANLMVRRQINRVPVLRDGTLVGIVSRADILRIFARRDEDIATAVRDALLRDLWIDVTKLEITADQGVVRLAGEVDRRSDKELAERWAATVDGVVKVESDLTYRWKDRELRMPVHWM